MRKLLVLVMSLGVATLALAQQYKWVDKNGKVQYGDAPPPGVKATPLRPPPPAAQPAAGAAAPAAKDGKDAAKDKPLTPEQAFQKRQKEAQERESKAAKEAADARAKQENCQRARDQVATLSTGRVARTNTQGERVYLDDEQIRAETSRAQKLVDEWCR